MLVFARSDGRTRQSTAPIHDVDLKRRLWEFRSISSLSWLGHGCFVRAIEVASGKNEPTLEDLAKLSMKQVADAPGVGKTFLRTVVHFFQTSGIKTRCSWSDARYKALRKTHHKQNIHTRRRLRFDK